MPSRSTTSRHAAYSVWLPPSEGKAEGGDGPGWSPDAGAFGDVLSSPRYRVVEALATSDGGTTRLLGVSGRHLDRAVAANRLLLGAPTLPAWRRYTGVVWDHLDPATIPAARRRRIVVVSGLLGLVRGDDPVPDYRLKMGGSLAPVGKLSTWWRPNVTPAIVAASRRRFVVDLLPNEHRAALGDVSRVRGVRVTLRDRSGASGGHAAKAAKGLLARHLLTGDDPPIDALGSWTHEQFVLEVTRL